MRNKSIAIVVVIAILMVLLAYFMLFDGTTIFDEFKTARAANKAANDIDYDADLIEYNRLEGEIDFVESEITVLNANLKNIKADHQQKELDLRMEKTEEISQKATELRNRIAILEEEIVELEDSDFDDSIYLESTSDVIYSILLKSIKDTPVDIVNFFANESDKGHYTVKLVGYYDSVSNVLDNITANLALYDVSIGNVSLRQIYACYDNMRAFDQASLLNWFKNQYITGSGNIGSIDGGYSIDGVKLSGVIGMETVDSLKTEKAKAIAENAATYEQILATIESERLNAIMEAYNGTDAAKIEALVLALNAHYDKRSAETKAERDAKAAAIAKDFDDRIAAIEQGKPDEDDFNLADPDLLFYTLDLTFSVHSSNSSDISADVNVEIAE